MRALIVQSAHPSADSIAAGNALEFDVGNPILTFHEWHLKFGSVYKLFIFAMPVVQVNDPKLVRQIAADNETFPRGSWPWENDNQALGGEVCPYSL